MTKVTANHELNSGDAEGLLRAILTIDGQEHQQVS
jgi:hypothetical protein